MRTCRRLLVIGNRLTWMISMLMYLSVCLVVRSRRRWLIRLDEWLTRCVMLLNRRSMGRLNWTLRPLFMMFCMLRLFLLIASPVFGRVWLLVRESVHAALDPPCFRSGKCMSILVWRTPPWIAPASARGVACPSCSGACRLRRRGNRLGEMHVKRSAFVRRSFGARRRLMRKVCVVGGKLCCRVAMF